MSEKAAATKTHDTAAVVVVVVAAANESLAKGVSMFGICWARTRINDVVVRFTQCTCVLLLFPAAD